MRPSSFHGTLMDMNRPVLACLLALLLLPVFDAQEIVTDRVDAAALVLPIEDPAFSFAVFGDRTGGPAAGVEILEKAVGEVNLVGPDLVMTVGDLIEGYNQTPEWLVQMDEFKAIMNRLNCPWFPVAGNHDIYWRGPGKPEGEHESNYERHFGPLWYAFEHKRSWFIVLYSDEGDRTNNRKAFREPELQKVSKEQFAWLEKTLERASDAPHVFVFIHHPRWTEGHYGTDWRRVHEKLVKAGNVTAVFGGHIHYMRYDPKDGIEYFSLATVGGYQDGIAVEAGFADQYHLVTVRDRGIDVTAYPVGVSIDPRKVTGTLATEVRDLHGRLVPTWDRSVTIAADGSASAVLATKLTNPTSRPVSVSLSIHAEDSAWIFGVDHAHTTLAPGETKSWRVSTERFATRRELPIHGPVVNLEAIYRGAELAVPLPLRSFPIPLDVRPLADRVDPQTDGAISLDGEDDCLVVAHDSTRWPTDDLTLEVWVRGAAFADRVALASKNESSEFGLWANKGIPQFSIHLDGKYSSVENPDVRLAIGRWHHVAGTYDGAHVRLFVDGQLVASSAARGQRTTRDVPLLVGADVRASGDGMSFFEGQLDELRLSSVARYGPDGFEPQRQLSRDQGTLLHLPMTAPIGAWWFSAGPHATVLDSRGGPVHVPTR